VKFGDFPEDTIEAAREAASMRPRRASHARRAPAFRSRIRAHQQ
jgi:hypothetical protein